MTTLLEAHEALHRWLEDQAWSTLEALVQLDVPTASARFERWAEIFDAHMTWESEHVMPKYREVAPADGPGRADHIEGDHVILARHVGAIREVLGFLAGERAAGTLTLRDVLEELPALYRLIATLEHHTAREQSHVYPSVVVDGGERALAELLERARA